MNHITDIERRKSNWLVNASEGWQVTLTTSDGRTLLVSQLDHEDALRWQVDSEFLKNGYPVRVHTFGDRWIRPTLLEPDLAAVVTASVIQFVSEEAA